MGGVKARAAGNDTGSLCRKVVLECAREFDAIIRLLHGTMSSDTDAAINEDSE
jgi:hypothetical protein